MWTFHRIRRQPCMIDRQGNLLTERTLAALQVRSTYDPIGAELY